MGKSSINVFDWLYEFVEVGFDWLTANEYFVFAQVHKRNTSPIVYNYQLIIELTVREHNVRGIRKSKCKFSSTQIITRNYIYI